MDKMEDSEWAFWIEVGDVEKGKPVEYRLSPSKEECICLARRLGVEAVKSLEARVKVVRIDRRVLHVTGTLSGVVVQECVKTLESFDAGISDEFDAWYAEEDQVVSFARAKHEKQRIDGESENPVLDEKDDPEPIVDGRINLGELVTQYASLSIDPYPCKVRDEDVTDIERTEPVRDESRNPFAKLKELRISQSEEK
jgi:uncharacterized metal-binding protein YceD (DUF177 family)